MSHEERQLPLPGPPEFASGDVSPDLGDALAALLAQRTLSADEMAAAFESMMTGQVHHAEMGALLALLATRTPTAEEILGAARVMRTHVDPVQSACDREQIVDTAGTGGAPKTFNVSTAAAIVAAAASEHVHIAKHGNRSRTGRGSAEVLRQLGVNVDAPRETQATCLVEARICFCFAIHHHPATKHVMPVRRALGFPTIFNLLGPLTNPAGAKRQLMGVYDRRFLRPVAEALAALGTLHAMVVHSEDGLDEISIGARTLVMYVDRGHVTEGAVSPEDAGFSQSSLQSVTARSLDHAAQMIQAVLEGREKGPAREMTLLNAAATLMVAEQAQTLREGAEIAAKAIDSGAAVETLRTLAAISQR